MQRIVPIEIEPVVITTSDGKERQFLLSAGGLNRLKKRFNVATLKELLSVDETSAVTILYEALQDKSGLTEEAFNDVLPYNPAQIGKAIGMLLGASFPDPPPPTPTPATTVAVN